MADKLALVRSVQFVEPVQHELEEIFTGFPKFARRPAFGSVISRFGSHQNRQMPAYAAVSSAYGKREEVENPQYVGSAHRPLFLGSEGVQDLSLPDVDQSGSPVRNRRQMLTTFDGLRREVDAGVEAAGNGRARRGTWRSSSPAKRRVRSEPGAGDSRRNGSRHRQRGNTAGRD